MKKFISLIIILITTSLFSIEVDIDEISKGQRVDFTNFTGRNTKNETVSEIKSIGHRLSYLMKNGRAGVLYRFNTKYSIIRALSKDSDKFSADIFFINKDAQVAHIKNVRRIISSYLEGMYGYTMKEADAIAVYVTYYNAVYRGDLDYFSSNYSPEVMKHLTAKNAGISTQYTDWPGNTAIVIPLTEQSMRGGIGNIDTSVISDEKVKREVDKDRDGKETTKTMDEVKKKDIDRSKKTVEEQKKAIENRKESIAEREKALEKKKEEIKKDKEEAAKITDPEQRKAKEDEIKQKEDEVKREERRLAEENKRIDAAENQVKKAEDSVNQKQSNISNNQDQKKEAAKETAKESDLNKREDALKNQNKGDGIYGLKIYYLDVKDFFEGGHYNNILYMINTQTNKIELRSPFTNICGRKYDVFSNGIVVISHPGDHKSGHRLTLIDKDTLKEITTGTENIFWRSFVEIKNNHIYAVVKDTNRDDFYLGKFDTNLKLVAKSKEKVYLNTFLTFFNEYIYINRDDKAVMVLKESDLSLVSLIQP